MIQVLAYFRWKHTFRTVISSNLNKDTGNVKAFQSPYPWETSHMILEIRNLRRTFCIIISSHSLNFALYFLNFLINQMDNRNCLSCDSGHMGQCDKGKQIKSYSQTHNLGKIQRGAQSRKLQRLKRKS